MAGPGVAGAALARRSQAEQRRFGSDNPCQNLVGMLSASARDANVRIPERIQRDQWGSQDAQAQGSVVAPIMPAPGRRTGAGGVAGSRLEGVGAVEWVLAGRRAERRAEAAALWTRDAERLWPIGTCGEREQEQQEKRHAVHAISLRFASTGEKSRPNCSSETGLDLAQRAWRLRMRAGRAGSARQMSPQRSCFPSASSG